MATVKQELSEREQANLIKKGLKHRAVERQQVRWLDTGEALLHSVVGDPIKGIPFGKIIEISGPPGAAKSGLAFEISAFAHADGAHNGWCDFEFAWEDDWAAARGLDPEQVALFRPEVVEGASTRKKKKPTGRKKVQEDEEDDDSPDILKRRLLSAEEVLKEAEVWIQSKLSADPSCKVCLVIDSLPAMLPESAIERDLDEGQPQGGFASFLTRMLQKWVPLCFTHNVLLILINHMRTKPGVAFGDPTYEPGGSALYHYSSVKIRMRKPGGRAGAITSNGRRVGIKGFITNKKNKVGGLEETRIGFKFYYRKKPMKFLTYEEIKAETSGGYE